MSRMIGINSNLFLFFIRCGIVALAMAMNVTVENIFQKAKELLYTIQGELFDGKKSESLFKKILIHISSSDYSKFMPTI